MKLLIQIPSYNEEKTLPLVLKGMPKKINGITKIEILVIDDGSEDKTYQIAKKHKISVIRNKHNMGLGCSFKEGLKYAIDNNFDILVNTDADNQYPSKYIEEIVKPIIEHRADMVIGDRQTWRIKHFSFFKRIMQNLGSFVVRKLTNTNVPDTVSGFRAYSREAMYHLNITSKFSYVLDSIMQLSKKNLKIISIPIKTNPPTRKSRLFKNIFEHMYKSGLNILRVYIVYEPFKTFLYTSILFVVPGVILYIRFLYFFLIGEGSGHIQSLIIGSIFIISSLILFVLSIIAELLKTNRMLIEENLYYLKKNGK
jgi:glycosyltransferase involved in cell wall biosynthesis